MSCKPESHTSIPCIDLRFTPSRTIHASSIVHPATPVHVQPPDIITENRCSQEKGTVLKTWTMNLTGEQERRSRKSSSWPLGLCQICRPGLLELSVLQLMGWGTLRYSLQQFTMYVREPPTRNTSYPGPRVLIFFPLTMTLLSVSSWCSLIQGR